MLWLAVCFILLEEAREEAPAAHAAAAPVPPSGHPSRAPQSRPDAEQQALLLTAICVADAQDVQETELIVSPGRQPPHSLAECVWQRPTSTCPDTHEWTASEYLGS